MPGSFFVRVPRQNLIWFGGSMPRIKLTQRSVARLAAPTPTGKQVVYWDLDLRGFGVLVSGRTTVKSFIAQRDLQGGRTRRVTIAHVNELPLTEAKERARKLLVDMRAGKDPKQKAASGTLQETADLYLQSARLSQRTREIYSRLVSIHLAPLKNRALGSITPADIDSLHNRITGKAVANAAIRCFRLLYNWAARRDDSLPRNPVRLRGNEWHPTTPKRRPIPPEKLAAFYAAVQTLPPMLKDYVLLLLFTGMRRREGAALHWSEVDFERGLIHLPSARTKTRKPLDIPMCDIVRDFVGCAASIGRWNIRLSKLRRFWSSGACRRGDPNAARKDWLRIQLSRSKANVHHDCRVLDLSPYAIKALVNHALGTSVTEGYISMSVERLRGPAQLVCDRIRDLCGIARPSGNVAVLRASLPKN